MTLRVTITNEPCEPSHTLQVNVWTAETGTPKNIASECRELASGDTYTVTLWGLRGVTLAEQHIGE